MVLLKKKVIGNDRAIYFAFGIVLLSWVISSGISVIYVSGQNLPQSLNYKVTSGTGTFNSFPITLQVRLTSGGAVVGGISVSFYVDGMPVGISISNYPIMFKRSGLTLGGGYASVSIIPVTYGPHYWYIQIAGYNFPEVINTFACYPPPPPPPPPTNPTP